MKRKPMPIPKHTPWERKRCQLCVANEVVINESVSRIVPILRTRRMEYRSDRNVTTGDMTMAQAMLNPPTKAYSRGVIPGKTSLAR